MPAFSFIIWKDEVFWDFMAGITGRSVESERQKKIEILFYLHDTILMDEIQDLQGIGREFG